MRHRSFAALVAASAMTVAALGGVAYGTGLPPFARQTTPATTDAGPDRTPTADASRPTPSTRPAQGSPSPTADVPSPTATVTTTPTPTPDVTTPAAEPKPPALMELEDRTDQVRELEARLAQPGLISTSWVDGYFGTSTRTAVRSFQARHGLDELGYVDAETWREIRSRTRTPTRTELYPPKPTPEPDTASALDPRCTTGRAICIDKSTRTLRWVVDGTVALKMDARFGCQSSATREGAFSVRAKVREGYSNMYDSRMPFSLFFSGHQAVHYSDDFNARGYDGCSHGCVNIRNWNALSQLFAEARVGDKVIVYWS